MLERRQNLTCIASHTMRVIEDNGNLSAGSAVPKKSKQYIIEAGSAYFPCLSTAVSEKEKKFLTAIRVYTLRVTSVCSH
jgi:hypothetical protein